ncbi:glycosyltransferase family 4 protein [Promicromonospora sp. Populi]|uniref:glycosyltransferase family 4 protein n=1 Tax=Promicromonospora sp. Populi TaxID=3239420 RepID=UPI0034E23432
MNEPGDRRTRDVRVYKTLRTAHLERALTLAPADILYQESRYDFDEELAAKVRPEAAGDLRCAWLVARRGYEIVEINEPAAIDCVRRSAAVLAALLLSDLVRRRRTRIVAYAIGNLDPHTLPKPAAWWPRLGRRLDLVLARWVWSRLDRVAFGTQTARQLYGTVFGIAERRSLRWTTIEALPAVCECLVDYGVDGGIDGRVGKALADGGKTPGRLLFLGDLSTRKGFDSVLAAWTKVRHQVPDSMLTVVGRGALLDDAYEAARADSRIRVIADPPRDVVHAELRRASVVLLPSRRQGAWREQVGLPIVEGLAHGCTVVTTDETGIADWLRRAGHGVIPAGSVGELLAPVVAEAARRPLDPRAVRASLPGQDSRLEADGWLFSREVIAVGT